MDIATVAQTQTIRVAPQTQVEHQAQPILEEIRAVVLQVQAILVVILAHRIIIQVAAAQVIRVVHLVITQVVVQVIRVAHRVITQVVVQAIRVVHRVIVQEAVVQAIHVVPAQVRALEAAVADRLPLIQEVDKNYHKKRASSETCSFLLVINFIQQFR